MPWNPFKSKKDKADKGQPVRSGFHPIDLDALSKEKSPQRKVDVGGDVNRPESDLEVTSPARSDSSMDDAPLKEYPEYGRDGLLSAAFTGDITVLKLMLALGADAKLHKYDSLGNTPLHLAAFSGHKSAVKVLLDTPSAWHDLSDNTSSSAAGKVVEADVHAKNGEDDTPLYMAVLCNNIDIVKLLAEACGKNVNLSNVEGFTPLHYAAGEGNLSVTRFLVEECTADVDAKDKLGLTPAFCAVLQGRVEVAEYLLRRNPASVKIVNSSNDTMLHCAVKGLDTDPEIMSTLILLLISLGAPVDSAGGPPQSASVRELLISTNSIDRFALPPAPAEVPDGSRSSISGGGGRQEGAGEKGVLRARGNAESLDDVCVRELRCEAGKANYFKAYLCAASDIFEKPDKFGGIPKRPEMPLEFLQGRT
mmetsp:Transcript_37916/g.55680  ORF Transcript_37916/g.55680 Transcript_37916/m.55680 type:complete len:421 (-) Transcript_37916:303-1565(-)